MISYLWKEPKFSHCWQEKINYVTLCVIWISYSLSDFKKSLQIFADISEKNAQQ